MAQLRNIAIVGFAQLPVVARDEHRTATEMLYPVVREALQQCGVERDDIDYQIAGSTDYMDGRPFGFVAALESMGSWPPREDLHLEMDGTFCAYYAWLRMQAGYCDTALIVAHGKVSEGEPRRVTNLQIDPYYHAPLGIDGVVSAALQASMFMARSGVSDRELAQVAARNRLHGAKNPDNQLRSPASAEELQRTPYVVEPLRAGYLPPVGESATCLILAAEGKAERMCERPAWIHGVEHRSELQTLGARDLSRSLGAKLAAEKALAMAGLDRADQVDLAELAATNPAEEMLLCEALGLDPFASRPVLNPSGGPLCADPVMSTGLIRLGEAFRQLSGRAGERTVSGAELALVHGQQGHCLQTNIVWICGSRRRWS
ncbi:MAG: lipid-transfer protein [Candidatus Binatia bacterium]|nr:lipid-transfer protein [Candidatus Binatia bacterium]